MCKTRKFHLYTRQDFLAIKLFQNLFLVLPSHLKHLYKILLVIPIPICKIDDALLFIPCLLWSCERSSGNFLEGKKYIYAYIVFVLSISFFIFFFSTTQVPKVNTGSDDLSVEKLLNFKNILSCPFVMCRLFRELFILIFRS